MNRELKRVLLLFVIVVIICIVCTSIWTKKKRKASSCNESNISQLHYLNDISLLKDVATGIQNDSYSHAIILFYATWCHNCHNAQEVFKQFHKTCVDNRIHNVIFILVDIDKFNETLTDYNIDSVPLIVVNNKEHDTSKTAIRLAQHNGPNGYSDQLSGIINSNS